MLRLLKLIRRFGQIQLLAHVFRQTGAAILPVDCKVTQPTTN